MKIQISLDKTLLLAVLLIGFLLISSPISLLGQKPTPPSPNTPLPTREVEIPDLPISKPQSSYRDYLPTFITDYFDERPIEPKPFSTGGPPSEELAILLDGRSGFVMIPHDETLNFPTQTTIEAWIKTAEMGKDQGILEKYQSNVGGFSLRITAQGVLNFSTTEQGPDKPGVSLTGETLLNPNVWHHIACILDGKNLYVYLDGKLEVQKEGDVRSAANSADLTIGLTHGETGAKQFFNGLIDEARISNYAVYRESFQPEPFLYGGGIFGLTAGSWRFTDQQLEDGTGNHNHGTIFGNVTFITDTPSGESGSSGNYLLTRTPPLQT